MIAEPVYLCVRDRVTDLRGMVEWLERAGAQRIILLDNDSTYGPLLDYFKATPHEVIRLGENVGHMALFWRNLAPTQGRFFYGDPDCVIEAPLDGLRVLLRAAEEHPEVDKIGFGLSLEGVSESMRSYAWERELWSNLRICATVSNGEREINLYNSPVDTTLAVYNRPTTEIWSALRLGPPYVMRHSSWYADPLNLSEEDRYYLERASQASSWKQGLG